MSKAGPTGMGQILAIREEGKHLARANSTGSPHVILIERDNVG